MYPYILELPSHPQQKWKDRWHQVQISQRQGPRPAFLKIDRDPYRIFKARETAGDAIVNYESGIVAVMDFLNIHQFWPNKGHLYYHCAPLVSNEGFYNLRFTKRLALDVQILEDDYDFAYRGRSSDVYYCRGKLFGDLFEMWVFEGFEKDLRRGEPWYRARSYRMRERLMEVGAIRHGDDFKRNITKFALRIRGQHREILTGSQHVCRNALLQEYGFETMVDKTTVFLDCFLLNNRGKHMNTKDFNNFLDVLAYIGKEHMRRPAVLNGFDRGLKPGKIDDIKRKVMGEPKDSKDVKDQPKDVKMKARRRWLWFGLVGALVMDRRNLSRDGDLDYVHVHRVYRTFFLDDGTLNLLNI